jgi:hypothetical protein
VTRRTLSILVATLVGVATLAPAALTSAHPPSVGAECPRELAPGAARTMPQSAMPLTTEVPTAVRHAKADARAPEVSAPWSAGAVPAGLAGLLAGLVVALAGLVAAPWRRRIVAPLTVLALVTLAFEAGIHSVHHLGDKSGAAHCSVASASTHLSGTAADGPSVGVPVLVVPAPPAFQTAPAGGPPLRSASGRGPPASLNA